MVRWPRSGRRAPRENRYADRLMARLSEGGALLRAGAHLRSCLLLGLPNMSTVGIRPIATMRKPTTATKLTYPFSTP